MAAHVATKAKAATLAKGATDEQAKAEAEKAVAEALGGLQPLHTTT